MSQPADEPNSQSSSQPNSEADALLTAMDQQLAIKRSARAMRRNNRALYRMISVILLVVLLLGAAYTLMMSHKLAARKTGIFTAPTATDRPSP